MTETYQKYLKMADFGLVSEDNDPGLTKREDWIQLVTPEAPTHWRNGVFHSAIRENAEERVQQVIAEYTEKKLPFRWMVSPYSEPKNLSQILVENGFEHLENTIGMVLDLDKYQTRKHDSIDVRQIRKEEIELWCNVNCNSWGIPEQGRLHFIKSLEAAFKEEPIRKFYYLANLDGIDIGAAASTEMDGFANFSGAIVEQGHRGKGVYRAMIDKRVEDLKAKGYKIITNFCVENTSAPICLSLGFEQVFKYSTYIYEGSSKPPLGQTKERN